MIDPHEFSDSELEAYLEEALPTAEAARIEDALRGDAQLVNRLSSVNRRRDSGLHTLGEIWRRHRLSCPPRQQLGSYLLDVLDQETANYVYFHVTEIGCRYCEANLEDLKKQQDHENAVTETRRRKYFESSAGLLR